MTSIGGSAWTGSYDAAGNMTCRAPTSATTCVGTPTGAQLSYDNEGRLSSWVGGTTTASYLSDGEGKRVEQSVTVNGSFTSSTTYVAGGQEEIANNGSSTTLTKYFPGVSGLPVAERNGATGALTYLASDGQGSVSAALDSNGNVTFQQLYTPYGAVRYSNGSSPTSYAYTGQLADSATGLDYYQARYYDPVAQQFVSADTVQDGLSGYGYTGGNPTTYTDPSGHAHACPDSDCGGPPPPPPGPTGCRATGDCPTGGGGHGHGHGGGGHGGGGCGGNPKACTLPGALSTHLCNNVCLANRLAVAASGLFSTIAWAVGVIGTVVSVLLMAVAGPAGLFWGGTLLGITISVASIANRLQQAFADYNDGYATDPGTFNEFATHVSNMAAWGSLLTSMIGGLLALFPKLFTTPLSMLAEGGSTLSGFLSSGGLAAGGSIVVAGMTVGLVAGSLLSVKLPRIGGQ